LILDRRTGMITAVFRVSLWSPLVGGPFRAENGGWLSADVVAP
jgi:hypothetical protein